MLKYEIIPILESKKYRNGTKFFMYPFTNLQFSYESSTWCFLQIIQKKQL